MKDISNNDVNLMVPTCKFKTEKESSYEKFQCSTKNNYFGSNEAKFQSRYFIKSV